MSNDERLPHQDSSDSDVEGLERQPITEPAELDADDSDQPWQPPAASEGTVGELGPAFEQCKRYLQAIAREALDPPLRSKISSSDLVQQTYLAAHRDYHQFEGSSPAQLRAWLRRILLNRIANCRRHYAASKRDVGREQQVGDGNHVHDGGQAGRRRSPSSLAAFGEEISLLKLALPQLTEQQRLIIQLRNLERKSFSEIAEHLTCSSTQARRQWFSSIERLKDVLQVLQQQQV